MKRYLVVPVLLGCFLMNPLSAASTRAEDLTPLLDNITKQMNSHPENNNWRYKKITRSVEADKNWQPKETTITEEEYFDVEIFRIDTPGFQ